MTRPFLIAHMCLALFVGAGLPLQVTAQEVARPVAPDSTRADSLLAARERAQWDALKTRDTTTFARLMGGNVVDVDVAGIKHTSPSSVARYVTGCRIASYALSDILIAHYSATAVVTYNVKVDATCWGQKAPSPLYVMTVYEWRESSWLPIAHSETPAARW